MWKLKIILCVAVFASTVNAAFVTDQLEKAQESLNKLIESTIARVKSAVADTKTKSEELSVQIETQIDEYKKRISNDVESKVQKAVADINELTDSIKDVDVTECSKLVDHLQATAHTAILQMKKCFVNKRATAAEYIENMLKVADEVLASLHIHKLDARACVDNIDGIISVGKALVCTNLVAAKAGWTAARAAPAISVEGGKLTLLLTTLPSSLAICTATSALNTFYYEAFGIVENSTNCVRQRIEEIRNEKRSDHGTPPKNSVITESLPTTEPASTSKPEGTSTPAIDAMSTTTEIYDADF